MSRLLALCLVLAAAPAWGQTLAATSEGNALCFTLSADGEAKDGWVEYGATCHSSKSERIPPKWENLLVDPANTSFRWDTPEPSDLDKAEAICRLHSDETPYSITIPPKYAKGWKACDAIYEAGLARRQREAAEREQRDREFVERVAKEQK